jgi:Tfp pilus assembly protein PilP
MKRFHRILRYILILIPVLILLPMETGMAAQKEGVSGDKRPPKEVGNTKEPETEKEKEKEYKYLYDPTGKTDPFKSFIAIQEEKEEKEKEKPKTYLETLELSQLDLEVIVISPKGKWAVVRDSKGLGHVIQEGTPIGTNGGVVYKIAAGEVVIREDFKDFRGRTQHRDIIKRTPSASVR